MSAKRLLISPLAVEDLKGIYQFGLRNWGQLQSTRYIEALKETIWTLAEQPLMGTERQELLPKVRSLTIKSHVLFYRVQSNQVDIIRVLHARQDPYKHVK